MVWESCSALVLKDSLATPVSIRTAAEDTGEASEALAFIVEPGASRDLEGYIAGCWATSYEVD